MSQSAPPNPLGKPHPLVMKLGIAMLGLLVSALFVLRVTGPPNLIDNDQERPTSYVLDALLNHHWLCQRDWTGDIMSKPPLYSWISAVVAMPAGHLNYFTLYFPCFVAALLIVSLLYITGTKHFGWRAGLLAGVFYLTTPAGAKHMALARTDGLFAATITLTALLGFRAWSQQKGWVWFWLAAALATLTKGPLGVLLASLGLLAAVWESRGGRPARIGGSHWAGLAVFALVAGGWFALAYHETGQPFIDKIIKGELVAHAVATKHGHFGRGFGETPFFFLTRFLPWSLVAVVGLWRIWRWPAADETERRFERFLFCWVVGGLFVFALGTHQRSDLVLPVFPAAALLAGREIANWTRRWSARQFTIRVGAVAVFWLAAYGTYLHTAYAKEEEIVQTYGLEELARTARQRVGETPAILQVDSPFTLHYYLNSMQHKLSFEQAAERLRGSEAVLVSVRNEDKLRLTMGPDAPPLYEVAAWPATGKPFVRILSNRPVSAAP